MAGTKEIKRRIKSVKNTKKITKAMELVAASKMKRAVSSTLASRLYALYSWEVLTSVGESLKDITDPLFVERDATNRPANTLMIIITSNRGLCGAYNAQVIKKAVALLKTQDSDTSLDVIAVGKRGDTAMRRVGKNIIASFTELPDNIDLSDVSPLSKLVLGEYMAEKYDKVFVVYTDFISALTQKPNIKQILPIHKSDLKELIDELETKDKREKDEVVSKEKTDYVIEGDLNALAGSLAEKITQMQIYQMLLESNASEQSSRMVAMKNASDASGEMIDDLTLVFNKARQSNITREISEISAGMAAAQ